MTRHGKAAATPSNSVDSPSSGDLSSITVDTSQRSGESSTNEVAFAAEAVGEMEALVESFRTGKTRKSETIFKIGQVLANQSTGDEKLRSDSLERYALTLDGIEAIINQSNRHGMHATGSLLGKR